ncbi:MAG: GNAT family N-acetyltransferase [Ahrensia sp.]|nr:GNAT family N-acetyltransferase [Ahrensia sp.]|tara:strand:+ start:66088 stop:66762 length:675 start_codon:yes stop_codon:yes gene_type:complete
MPFNTRLGADHRSGSGPKDDMETMMTLHSPIALREATPADAPALARLIDIAGEGIPAWLWSQMATEGRSPIEVGEERARRETGGFSWRNALVAERDGKVAAMMLGYPIGEPSEAERAQVSDLPAPVRPFVELEHRAADSFYVNALATLPGRRGFGLGAALMQAAEAKAKAQGISRMSIQVYEQNTGAVRLYERLGYSHAETRPVLSHPCQPYYDGRVLLLLKDI